MMDQASSQQGLPPGLRFLKGLVILLTLTMIVGVITVVALLVTRIPGALPQARGPALPAAITLPEGLTAGAVTFGTGWIAVVARDAGGTERILVFDPEGKLRQDVAVAAAP